MNNITLSKKKSQESRDQYFKDQLKENSTKSEKFWQTVNNQLPY